MGNGLNFEAHDEPLRDILFSNSKFRIPRYQRPYAWTEDQASDFWTDLTESKGPFFLGSFIFNKESLKDTGFYDVIDGQQRLLTVTILMAALRDISRGVDPETSRLIQWQDIAIVDRTGKQSYRVMCGDSTKDFFMNNVQAEDADISKATPSTPEEQFIKQNYQFFRGKIEADMERCDSQTSKLDYIRRLSQCYVLFLSILRNYDKLGTDPTRVFEAVERFSFLYSAVCKMQANKVEKIYSTYARRIEECVQTESGKKVPGKIQSLFDSLVKDLRDEKPSFDLFKERFEDVGYGWSPRSRQFVGYILNTMECGDGEEEKTINFDKVNIEHVLPQTPGKDWGLSKKEIRNYVNMLGNLTLVSSKLNSKVGNKGIQDKVTELEKSQVRMTNELAAGIRDSGFKWGETEIRRRQSELAELAYKRLWVL